jgi:glyoxylase-like metal-dependent hydrolase (beta-lactamase superfamily II)
MPQAFSAAMAGRARRDRAILLPMPAADEFQNLGGGWIFWQVYDPAVKTELTCSAFQAGRAWFFVDPIALAGPAMDELAGRDIGEGAVLLTNGNHERAAAAFRDRFHLPVVGHAGAAPEITITLDRVVGDGEILFGQFAVIALPGAAAGEVAYFHAASRTLCVGDALIHLDPLGFAPLPAKYCGDARALRAALPRLLDHAFEQITFAHGLPIRSKAHARLASLIDSLA